MTIVLKNLENRMQTFNLPAPKGVESEMQKTVEIPLQHQAPDGTRGILVHEQTIHGSVSIPAKTAGASLPDWVVKCPEVAAAVRRGAVKVIESTQAAGSAPPVTTPPKGEAPAPEAAPEAAPEEKVKAPSTKRGST